MVEENKEKKKNYKTMPIGKGMVALIDLVDQKFKKEYPGLNPTKVDISNVIAKRVMDHELF